MTEHQLDKAKKKIFEDAKKVLEGNWIELEDGKGYTRPAEGIYPLQWSSDSSFAAYGYSHYDVPKAITELRTLFDGQWSNGFLPHINFHRKVDHYFPNEDFWDSKNVTDKSPRDVGTSGITQPPIVAMAVWHIYKRLKLEGEEGAQAFLDEFYPKLYKLHKYFHEHRDPENWGLVTIYHPWESGFDNSPRWDDAMAEIIPKDLPEYERMDTRYVDKENRPTDDSYDKYVYLALELKKKNYDDELIYRDHPFRVKDKVTSSILYMADKRLKEMAETAGYDTSEIDRWMKLFEENLNSKLWNAEKKSFYDFDLNKNDYIKVQTAGALMPLTTGILSKEQIKDIVGHMNSKDFCGDGSCIIDLIPSNSINEETFDDDHYWRGPIWINVNWFMWKGFKEYDMKYSANSFKKRILNLIENAGFWEYYSPITGKGTGAKDFSWTAALTIDILFDDL
ncbi:hypothetical protein HON59_01950 [bacterium]|nr:hypothetical protein [bacterium]MBT3729860.1 hypothetical protein [bacterium]MBT4894806.1 hypothetical protein [bacterium]